MSKQNILIAALVAIPFIGLVYYTFSKEASLASVTSSAEMSTEQEHNELPARENATSDTPGSDSDIEVAAELHTSDPVVPENNPEVSDAEDVTACTKDALECSDGSFVGREGPNCEFAKCPAYNPESTEDEDEVLCTQDAFACPDGSFVGREGPNCEFAACPIQHMQLQMN